MPRPSSKIMQTEPETIGAALAAKGVILPESDSTTSVKQRMKARVAELNGDAPLADKAVKPAATEVVLTKAQRAEAKAALKQKLADEKAAVKAQQADLKGQLVLARSPITDVEAARNAATKARAAAEKEHAKAVAAHEKALKAFDKDLAALDAKHAKYTAVYEKTAEKINAKLAKFAA